MTLDDARIRMCLRILASVGLIGALTFLCSRVVPVNATTVALAFLLAALVIATWWSLVEAVIASIVAMLCFNYFFLPPIGAFTIADPQNWIALSAFLVTAIIASHLSTTAKQRAREAQQRQAEMERLYNLSRALLMSETHQPAVAREISGEIASVFEVDAVAIFDRRTGEVHRSGLRDAPIREDRLRDAAIQDTVIRENGLMVLPIRLGGNPIGSVGLLSASISETAAHSIANLVAISLERARGIEAAARAEAARQNQELKSTLLDAVAHEFKTPLTSVKAAVSSLMSSPAHASEASRTELLAIINEETDRMSRMVTEAIDMARIEAGELRLNIEPRDPTDIIRSAVRRIEPSLDGRRILTTLPDELRPCSADAAAIETVLVVLLDNALKYSDPNTPIMVSAEGQGDAILFTVSDQGPGIRDEDRERIFDRFYRSAIDRQRMPGTGMGLAIAREIVEAHGSRIWVESKPGEGSRFCFTLPTAAREAALP
jgi:two-component system sensor histidine kinase KdpD